MNLIELVPRDTNSFLTEVDLVLNTFPDVDGINVPDVLRLPVRSYDAVRFLLAKGCLGIPHIRTIDCPLHETLKIILDCVQEGLTHVLLVTGDKPPTGIQVYDVSPIDVAKELKKECPELKVYGALDPYRQSLKDELHYCYQKIQAGMDGVFTQPFFDLKFAQIYLDQLKGIDVFIGISPVVTDRSFKYWMDRNNVIFPASFELDLDYNCRLAKDILHLTQSYDQHNYLMPIKVPVVDYLKGIWTSKNLAENQL